MYYKALQFFFSLKIHNCIIINTIPEPLQAFMLPMSLSQLMPAGTLNVKVEQGPSPGSLISVFSQQESVFFPPGDPGPIETWAGPGRVKSRQFPTQQQSIIQSEDVSMKICFNLFPNFFFDKPLVLTAFIIKYFKNKMEKSQNNLVL